MFQNFVMNGIFSNIRSLRKLILQIAQVSLVYNLISLSKVGYLLEGKNVRSAWICTIFEIHQTYMTPNFPRFSPYEIDWRKARDMWFIWKIVQTQVILIFFLSTGWTVSFGPIKNQISDTVCILAKNVLGWNICIIVVFF